MIADTSETVGRSPVQVGEIQTVKCANRFGCGACRAGLGALDASDISTNFGQAGANGWSGTEATVSRIPGGLNVAWASGTSPRLQIAGATGFDGDDFHYVVVWGRANADIAGTKMVLDYESGGGGFTASSQQMTPVNLVDPFRGVVLDQLKAGQEFVAVFDAATSTDYATAWQGSTVTGFRLFPWTGATMDADIYSFQVCANNIYQQRGQECFNTRQTCTSLDDFRAVPDRHIQQTGTYRDEDTVEAADYTTDQPAFFAADVRGDIDPSGTIFAFGSASNFIYLGITGSDLVFAAGGNTVADQARATVAAGTVSGRNITLIGEVDYDGDAVSLYEFDPITRDLSLLATGSAGTALPAAWAAATDGVIGDDGGTTFGSEDGGIWVGNISGVRGYSDTLFDGRSDEVFKYRHLYGLPNQEQPADDLLILPYLRGTSTAPTKVSLAGSNTNTDPIGNRARAKLVLTDQPGSDFIEDPYLDDRLVDPLKVPGSYWSKWAVRQKQGRISARVLIYEGYAGQYLADMNRREYVFEDLSFESSDMVQVVARDVLSKAELKKSQTPETSTGKLNAGILAAGLTFQVKDADLRDYPSSGTVRIDKEVITYSARVLNGVDPALIDFTVSGRGTDKSIPEDHDEDDTVQVCERFTNARIDDILTRLLADRAEIYAQYLDIENWDLEEASFLSAYTFSTLITEPTATKSLVGEVIQSAASLIFWDERDQLIKLQAFKALVEVPGLITERQHMIGDVKVIEKPKELATRVQVFHDPVTFTDRLEGSSDFVKADVQADIALEGDDAAGRKQIRSILSRWIDSEAQALQTSSRLAARYIEVPVELTFTLDRSFRKPDGTQLWIGDISSIEQSRICTALGEYDPSRFFIVTSAEEIVPGEMVRYTVEDATLAGFTSVIAPDAQGDHTGTSVDGFYGFIGDNSGNQSDGSVGSKIT